MFTAYLTPELQTYVLDNAPTTNFNGENYLVVGKIATTIPSYVNSPANQPIGTYKTWLRFDLSSIPASAVIISATLTLVSLYQVEADYTSTDLSAKRCTDITFANTITYNTAPVGSLTGANFIGSLVVGGPGNEATFTIRDMVRNALSTGKVAMQIVGSGTNDDYAVIQSSKFGGVTSPQLAITYAVGDVISTFFE